MTKETKGNGRGEVVMVPPRVTKGVGEGMTLVAPPEVSGGERSEPEGAGGGATSAAASRTHPDTEVPAKAKRRRFSAKYKLRIIEEADACTELGEVGKLLRREGLYYSHLTAWRKAKREGTLAALSPKKRGRKAKPQNPLAKEVARLRRENTTIKKKLRKAELIIEVQKKVAWLLGNPIEDERS